MYSSFIHRRWWKRPKSVSQLSQSIRASNQTQNRRKILVLSSVQHNATERYPSRIKIRSVQGRRGRSQSGSCTFSPNAKENQRFLGSFCRWARECEKDSISRIIQSLQAC